MEYKLNGYKFDVGEFFSERIKDLITEIRVDRPEIVQAEALSRVRREKLTRDGRLTVLATAADAGGRPNPITLSWHSPVSRDPPLYGISVAFTRASHGMLSGRGEWVVNFLPSALADKVHHCGTRSGKNEDKFAQTGLTPVPSKNVAPPRIGESYCALECREVDRRDLGDHTWFTGEVVAAWETSASHNRMAVPRP